jgi:hypothetical protein
VKKILEEIDKLEYSGLAFNQMLRIIKNFIANKFYFCFENMAIEKKYLIMIDQRKKNDQCGQPFVTRKCGARTHDLVLTQTRS